MIIQTIYKDDFINAFKALRPDNFTNSGLYALYDYLDDLYTTTSDDIQDAYNLDVIALCCDYSEYADLAEIKDTYPNIDTIEDLENHTQVIQFDGGIIIQNF